MPRLSLHVGTLALAVLVLGTFFARAADGARPMPSGTPIPVMSITTPSC
jgi:hypothetical protein